MNEFQKQDERRLGDRLEDLDKAVRKFTRATQKKLKQSAATQMAYTLSRLQLSGRAKVSRYVRKRELSRRGRKSLPETIKGYARKQDGVVSSVGFSFERHGIFFERGVGRGRPEGSSAAKQAEHPWLSTVIPQAIDELADLIAEEYSDVATANIRINIPGVITTTVSK